MVLPKYTKKKTDDNSAACNYLRSEKIVKNVLVWGLIYSGLPADW